MLQGTESTPLGGPSTIGTVPGTVSIDLDSARTHLSGYGFSAPSRDALIERAVDRLGSLLEQHAIRATFFAVAADLPFTTDMLRSLVAAGHEIASHSVTHPDGLSRLDPRRRAHELSDSRSGIEQAIGRAVVGFRAPSWDVRRSTLNDIVRAGYRYDASVLPTPWLPAARVAVALKARRPGLLATHALLPPTLRRRPYRMRTPDGTIVEFPVSVTERFRWPVYHTLRYGAEDERFSATIARGAGVRRPLSYPLHAIDAVGVAEDELDARLRRHPGGDLDLASKLALLDRTFAVLSRHHRLVPFVDRLGDDLPS